MKNQQLIIAALSLGLSLMACKEGKKVEADNTTEPLSYKDMVSNSVTPDAPKDTVNVAKIVFEKDVYDFGTIKDGEKVTYSFKFKNEGVAPLLISDASSSCGCTVPEWPKDPIPVGGKGEITVTFNSSGKGAKGGSKQKKPIYITANTWPARKTYAHIEGTVLEK